MTYHLKSGRQNVLFRGIHWSLLFCCMKFARCNWNSRWPCQLLIQWQCLRFNLHVHQRKLISLNASVRKLDQPGSIMKNYNNYLKVYTTTNIARSSQSIAFATNKGCFQGSVALCEIDLFSNWLTNMNWGVQNYHCTVKEPLLESESESYQ
jgi:hypothetical protein